MCLYIRVFNGKEGKFTNQLRHYETCKVLPSRSWCTGLRKGTGKGLIQGQGQVTNNFKDQDKSILVQVT
jgi:hypothetical protein